MALPIDSENVLLVSGDSPSAQVWNLRERALVRTLGVKLTNCFAICRLSRDRVAAANYSSSGMITVFDLETGAQQRHLRGFTGTICGICFVGSTLLGAGYCKDLLVFEEDQTGKVCGTARV